MHPGGASVPASWHHPSGGHVVLHACSRLPGRGCLGDRHVPVAVPPEIMENFTGATAREFIALQAGFHQLSIPPPIIALEHSIIGTLNDPKWLYISGLWRTLKVINLCR